MLWCVSIEFIVVWYVTRVGGVVVGNVQVIEYQKSGRLVRNAVSVENFKRLQELWYYTIIFKIIEKGKEEERRK